MQAREPGGYSRGEDCYGKFIPKLNRKEGRIPMKAWCWCPYCQRAFEGEVAFLPDGGAEAQKAGAALMVLTDCPFDGCSASASQMLAWSMVRQWAGIFYAADFPAEPVRGELYELPLVALGEQPGPPASATATAEAAG